MRPSSRHIPPFAAVALAAALALPAVAQDVPGDLPQIAPATAPSYPDAAALSPDAGRPVLDVRVVGNKTVSDTQILNAIRTKAGQPFDPRTVVEDYQRIYALRRFSRVEARYEDSKQGVSVVFDVEEQPPLNRIRVRGNRAFSTDTIRRVIERDTGRNFDPIMLAFAQSSIERIYRDKNFALAQVTLVRDEKTGVVTFDIVEGPKVFVRNVDFVGARNFGEAELKKQIGTKTYWPLSLFGHDGEYDPRQLDEDVASLQRFYRDKGYFDARVGRKVVWSPDLKEVQVDFLIDEGLRYVVDKITFKGNERLSGDELTQAVKLKAGDYYDKAVVRRAEDEMVRAYSPFGLIYNNALLQGPNPDYLDIREAQVFELEPGRVELVFTINEGKPFTVGNIEVRGNDKTQDKVIRREFDVTPGEKYDSADVQRAVRRLQATRFFSRVNVTPVGDDPNSRDILVEVEEQSTAVLTFGGAVSSNGGLIGSLKYEQSNFDIGRPPTSFGDFFGGDALVGGGQTFRLVLEPGTLRSNATVTFFEPYFLDQNLGFGTDAFYTNYIRRRYNERRTGGRLRLNPRVGRNITTSLILRGEDVRIFDVDDPRSDRATDILDYEGHTTLTSVGGELGYRQLDSPILPSLGFSTNVGWESYGVLGGPTFQKLTASFDGFVPLYRDLTARPTVLELRVDGGYLYNDAPFFERFYAGGFGSLRGFAFRGVSPRQGAADDAIGGDFSVTGSLALGFPLVGNSIRGVVFNDFGAVDSDLKLGVIRDSVGFGFRFQFEPLGNVPIALDLAWPLNAADQDDRQVFSFSLGVFQ